MIPRTQRHLLSAAAALLLAAAPAAAQEPAGPPSASVCHLWLPEQAAYDRALAGDLAGARLALLALIEEREAELAASRAAGSDPQALGSRASALLGLLRAVDGAERVEARELLLERPADAGVLAAIHRAALAELAALVEIATAAAPGSVPREQGATLVAAALRRFPAHARSTLVFLRATPLAPIREELLLAAPAAAGLPASVELFDATAPSLRAVFGRGSGFMPMSVSHGRVLDPQDGAVRFLERFERELSGTGDLAELAKLYVPGTADLDALAETRRRMSGWRLDRLGTVVAHEGGVGVTELWAPLHLIDPGGRAVSSRDAVTVRALAGGGYAVVGEGSQQGGDDR